MLLKIACTSLNMHASCALVNIIFFNLFLSLWGGGGGEPIEILPMMRMVLFLKIQDNLKELSNLHDIFS